MRQRVIKHLAFWLVLILVATGLQVLGRMGRSSKQGTKVAQPASVSKMEGTELVRLTLTPEAVKRLDIQTSAVREQQIDPTQQVAGEVIKVDSTLHTAIVRVELTENEARSVRREEPAFILPLARESKAPRVKAVPLSGAIADTLSLDSKARRIRALPANKPGESGLSALPGTLHFETTTNHGLVNRQLVFVELQLSGAGEKRKFIPYAAVLYDAKGNTWVYTTPEQNVFVRKPVRIDTIMGNEAILLEGPSAGTPVVTVGGAELYGTEFGVGK